MTDDAYRTKSSPPLPGDPSQADAPWLSGNLEPGAQIIPGYPLVARLGRGGFGEVWKATGPGGVQIALKFVRFDNGSAAREAEALDFMKQVGHPHLLPIVGIWNESDFLVIGMELADRSLAVRLNEALGEHQPGIPFPELIAYLREAAEAIDFLNEPRHTISGQPNLSIIHRDIKPQNLLLLGGGLKVADFGLARVVQRSLVSVSGGMTPAYAAPEFFQGHVSRHSDQYSLAVSYCQLRCAQLPFRGSPLEVMAGHLCQQPDLNFLPEREQAAVARALAKSPADRWPTCRAFVEGLAGVPGAGCLGASVTWDRAAAQAARARRGDVSITTESEWLASATPSAMLRLVRSRVGDRKMRLFACACSRRVWPLLQDFRSRQAVETAERYADSLASEEAREAAHAQARIARDAWKERLGASLDSVSAAYAAAAAAAMASAGTTFLSKSPSGGDFDAFLVTSVQVAFAKSKSRVDQTLGEDAVRAEELRMHCQLLRDIMGNPFQPVHLDRSRLTEETVALARYIYEQKAFEFLPMLADNLEYAGCTNGLVLYHCREPGEHVKGCWVIDAVLGKS
jgi:hypothetical protein